MKHPIGMSTEEILDLNKELLKYLFLFDTF